MTTKTIPAYLEDERRKRSDTDRRMQEEIARTLLLHQHRTVEQPKLEILPPVAAVPAPAPKARKTAAAATRIRSHAAKKTPSRARKIA